MREIRVFELDGRQAVSWQSAAPQSLQVLQGLLWVTVENNLADFWLRAGDSIDIFPGQRLWLGTWNDGARFRIGQPLPDRRPFRPFRLARGTGWRRVMGTLRGTLRGWRPGRPQ